MRYHTISIDAAQGKRREALDAISRLAEYTREIAPELHVQILMRNSGNRNSIVWMESFDSMATWEECYRRMSNDPEWGELYSGGIELFDMSTETRDFFVVVNSSE